MKKKYLGENSTPRLIDLVKKSIGEKQDKINGSPGDLVSIDDTGNVVSKSVDTIDTGVVSFNGRKGEIGPEAGDYTAEQVGAAPSDHKHVAEDITSGVFDGKKVSFNNNGLVVGDQIEKTDNGFTGGLDNISNTCHGFTYGRFNSTIISDRIFNFIKIADNKIQLSDYYERNSKYSVGGALSNINNTCKVVFFSNANAYIHTITEIDYENKIITLDTNLNSSIKTSLSSYNNFCTFINDNDHKLDKRTSFMATTIGFSNGNYKGISIGNYNSTKRSITLGDSNVSSDDSIAIGNNSNSKYNSITIGYNNICLDESYAFGLYNKVLNEDSCAIGYSNVCVNESSMLTVTEISEDKRIITVSYDSKFPCDRLKPFQRLYPLTESIFPSIIRSIDWTTNKIELFSPYESYIGINIVGSILVPEFLNNSDAIGYKGKCSYAFGNNLRVHKSFQTVVGVYNKPDVDGVFVIGAGTDGSSRSNAFRVAGSGGVYANGEYHSTGADYAEMFEYEDGNPNNEDRVGRFVTLNGDKIRLANSDDDFILGIISGAPTVVGDVYDDQWKGMFMYDIYGRPILEEVTIPEQKETVTNDDGIEEEIITQEQHTEIVHKVNPNYNPNEKYIPRSQRKEWGTVGMMGKLTLIDDGTCIVNEYCYPSSDGIGTHSDTKTKFRVIKRLDDTHVQVLIIPH